MQRTSIHLDVPHTVIISQRCQVEWRRMIRQFIKFGNVLHDQNMCLPRRLEGVAWRIVASHCARTPSPNPCSPTGRGFWPLNSLTLKRWMRFFLTGEQERRDEEMKARNQNGGRWNVFGKYRRVCVRRKQNSECKGAMKEPILSYLVSIWTNAKYCLMPPPTCARAVQFHECCEILTAQAQTELCNDFVSCSCFVVSSSRRGRKAHSNELACWRLEFFFKQHSDSADVQCYRNASNACSPAHLYTTFLERMKMKQAID